MKRLVILLLPLLVLIAPVQTQGQTTNRAGVVVQFGDGSLHTSCVAFKSESISGLELLTRSGLDVIAQSSGGSAAVCKIGPDGCAFPAEPCFCKSGGGQPSQYWAYWRLTGAAWRYSLQGAASTRVTNGAVDGWAWGTGNVQSSAQPPVMTFEQICPAVQPTAKPRPQPTTKPTIRPTARPTTRPTARPTTRPTARPTTRPTARVVVEAPTPVPNPPTTMPTLTATTTSTPSAAPLLPSSTPTPTATATSTPSATVPTTLPTPTTMVESDGTGSADVGNYLVFGAMLTGLLGAIGFARWRRRR